MGIAAVRPGWFFANGLAYVKQNGKYGYINKSGEVVIPIRYDDAENLKAVKQRLPKTGKVLYQYAGEK
ncbi:MAG: WG repeat-containing protein [Chitinophagaceae bacterium]|nr:WG repeat-containing protein [Chitinophagaceae bacterium]